MMRTAAAQSIELFPEDMPLFLDLDYWSRLGDCGTVGYMAGDFLRYRLNPEGAFAGCVRRGINLSDTDKLFRRLMAHWKWSGAEPSRGAFSMRTRFAPSAPPKQPGRKGTDGRSVCKSRSVWLSHGRRATMCRTGR
jgi:hypothetical protein